MSEQTTKVTVSTGLPSTFTQVNGEVRRRMIMSIEGDWGTGKTDLALTAPGPIAFFKFDLNADFTLSQWANKKVIYKREYEVIDPQNPKAQELAEGTMRTFFADYAASIRSPKIRTVIWDTASEIWEQIRLASFGKLTNILPHHYVQVNNSFRGLMRAAFDSDTNLIMIHRLKDEWLDSKRTGRKERAGFGDLGFACQVMVQTFFDSENESSPFRIKVLKCTQNPIITNRVYGQIAGLRTNAFPFLASDVFPGSQLEEWQ